MNLQKRSMSSRLDRIWSILICPDCRGSLTREVDAGVCASCTKQYKILDKKIYFIKTHHGENADPLDSRKSWLKGLFGRYYNVISDIVSPNLQPSLRRELRHQGPHGDQAVVDFGSGNRRVDENAICADFFPYAAVDIVCDLHHLPFQDRSVDVAVSWSVLEHVHDPHGVVAEMTRVASERGTLLLLTPFLYPFHASPSDFHRWTHEGIDDLLQGWEVETKRAAGGPVSAILCILTETLATSLSFGCGGLYAWTYLLIGSLIFPLKYLDYICLYFASQTRVAAALFTVARRIIPEKKLDV